MKFPAGALPLLLALGAARAAEPPTAALVIGAEPGPGADEIASLRARLGATYRLIEDPRARAVLEGFARVPSPEERAKGALERAHRRLRRFDLPSVKEALAEARAAAAELSPTPEGRALAAEIALREAALALVEGDDPAARAALALALSAEPALALDPAREPPALCALLERTRAALAAAPRAAIAVESDPPGALIVVAGASRGPAPLTVDGLAAGPHLLWATRPGSAPRSARALAAPGARATIRLPPLDEEARLRPLVDALRRADGEPRRVAALALAAALGVRAIAVAAPAPGAPPELFAPIDAAPRPPVARALPPPPPPRPWYRRGWVWGLAAGVVAGAALATTLGVTLSRDAATASVTCCR